MNWNNLTVNASIDSGQVLTPISGLTVTFALCDTVNSLYYYYDMVTDSNGNATLPASNTLVSQQVGLKVQTQAERENGGRYEDADSERKEIYGDRTNYNTTQIDSTIVNSVSTWYVGAVYNGYKIYSDTYPLTTTTGELRFKKASGGSQETKSGSFKIKVANSNNVLCNGANVYLWLYDSNWNCVGKHVGITTSHNDGAYYVASDIPDTADKYKVHAYYNGYENIDTTSYNLDMSDRTVVLGSVLNGYYFDLGKYYNVDTLFYYIGTDVDVLPYKLIVADSNDNTIFQQNVTSFSQIITGYCPTQYVRLYIAPYGTAILYDDCGTEFNIFGYLGGRLDAKTLSPRKEYKFETPFVYDTVIPSSEAIKCYNLPNTDIHINFYGWPDWTYDEDTSSNYPTISIVDSQIQTSSLNHNWFYRCLAGYNISANSAVRINLEKNHYNNISDKIITLSARTINGPSQQHMIPYSMTSDTVCYLYMCMNDPNGIGGNIAISPDRVETFTLEREGDAVFTRNEIRDYVSGFSFSYDGCFGQAVSPGRVVDYGGFTFPPLQKTPPSKQYLYEDATNGLPGTVTSSTLAGFQGNFIDLLYNDNFSTVYALPEHIADYTENNNHCYVMEESIIPNSKPVPDYFYFHNNCDIPTDAGIIATYGATQISEMNTTVGIRLEKFGNPGEISLQFSYNGHPWTDYEIGRELLLLKGDKIYFKAKSTNNTFSLDVSNYYKFVVNNNLYSDNENSPSYQQLIERFCQTTYLNYNTDKIIGNVKYDVIVGGKISSLLSVSTWETSSLNQYGFVNLFFQCGITRCIEPNNSSKYLDVDLLTAPAYGYKNMFGSTFYMINGPKIGATTVGTYAMESMFECSSLKELKDNKLYFTYPSSYCCYRMFADSRYNKTLTIIANNDYVSACFKEMFHQGKGSNASVRFTNATVFGTDWCRAMFSGSNTSVFCTFDNDIQDIGTTAFYEMYAKSKITSVTFNVTGSVQYRGCMRMCRELSSSYCNISYMQLNAPELHTECFSQMFYETTGTTGNFTFNVPEISESGCTYMFYHAGREKVENGVVVSGSIICAILGPTTLNGACYAHMFDGAGFEFEYSSKIAKGPALPSTVLFEECYSYMFHDSNIQMHYGQEVPSFENQFIPKEYVLMAPVLPKKCYYEMYSNSQMKYVSNVITRNLTTAGERSCGFMFKSTPITTQSRKRRIRRDDGYFMVFCSNWRDSMGHSFLTTGSNSYKDTACYVGKTVVAIGGGYNDASGKLYLLAGMSAVKNGTTYYFIDTNCNKLKSHITYNHQYIDVAMLNTGYTYYSTWFSDVICIIHDNGSDAYVMTRGYGEDNPSHIGENCDMIYNGVQYYGWHWSWISSKSNPKFESDVRTITELGNYAVYDTQEGTNGFDLSATYSVNIPNETYNETHTYEYVAFTEEVALCATTLSSYCYEYMFNLCTGLLYGHNFRFGNLLNLSMGCFSHMFDSCQGLRAISPDLRNFTGAAPYALEYMYANCSYNRKWDSKYIWFINNGFNTEDLFCGLNRIFSPSEMRIKYDYNQGRRGNYNAGQDDVVDYAGGDKYCAYFVECKYPYWGEYGGLDLKHSFVDCAYYTFNYNEEGCFRHMFENCLSLITSKIKLNSPTMYYRCYQAMFKGCGELVNNVYISENISNTQTQCCHAMFEGCYSYSGNVNSLHQLTATGMTHQCYASMFAGCGSMSAAPYLPATTMATGCYDNMFNTAVSNFYEIEIKVTLTAECLTNGSDLNGWHLYFGVSGTNYNSKIFYYFQNEDLDEYIFVNNSISTSEADYVNFEINNVMSQHKTWYTPNTMYFYENFNDAISAVQEKLESLCRENKILYKEASGKHYRITDYNNITVNYDFNGTRNNVTNGLRYLRCNISLSDLSSPYSYTYRWVKKIGDDDITKNGHYWGRAYQANHGESAIPTRWETHNA